MACPAAAGLAFGAHARLALRPAPSRTAATNRRPLRGNVLIRRCASPLSPIALRAALMGVVTAESETIARPRPPRYIVLADHAVAVADQVGEKIEDLRFERNQTGRPP